MGGGLALLFRERRAPPGARGCGRVPGRAGVSGLRRSPRTLALATPLLAIAAVAGIALAIVGATRSHACRLRLHIATAAVGALLVLVWMATTVARRARPGERRPPASASSSWPPCWRDGIVIVKDRREAPLRYRIVNPALPPESMDGEGGGPSPVLPSSAKTNVGGIIPSNFFMDSARPAARATRTSTSSGTRRRTTSSSFNNQWYRKSIEYMQDVVGTQPSKWCAGCHDHAVFFNGRFDRPIKEQIDTPEAQAGLALHVLPLHRPRRQLDGPGRLHDRIPAAARSGGEREPGAPDGRTTS